MQVELAFTSGDDGQKMGKLQKIPHLLSEPRYEIIQNDLNRKVGIIGMRREDFALVTGSDFRHHLILYEEECLNKR
jgi:hypothetical protein